MLAIDQLSRWRRVLRFVTLLACVAVARAFPPAPHHVIFGLVRTEIGDPLTDTDATIYLETPNGLKIQSKISPGIDVAANYRIVVPMDAGLTPDLYRRTALLQASGFRIKVIIQNKVYVPIEMTGNLAALGQPGGSTRIDLTLGEDADGDGLPDAWERAMIAALGLNVTPADFRPGDLAPNKMTYYQNYIAGTYPFDPQDEFKLQLAGNSQLGAPLLEASTISGRTYTLFGSSDVTTWTPLTFKLADGIERPFYTAADSQLIQFEVVQPAGKPSQFFKMFVQ
jgi:hypothetical protein